MVFAPVRIAAVQGCLMLMPRIQSPSGKVRALMRHAPRPLFPGGRPGAR
ncbi:hypothetical protein GA0115261_1050415 [Streptomyces sp. OspMP-M43]|nr:hypothetical protein GA0115261_1050415 [Streptomyces sp. OspMP-M43]